jgi:hypothetical protein
MYVMNEGLNSLILMLFLLYLDFTHTEKSFPPPRDIGQAPGALAYPTHPLRFKTLVLKLDLAP